MTQKPNRRLFTTSQWADIGILIVLIWGQIIVQFVSGDDHPWLVLVIGTFAVALMVKIYIWIPPLWRERRSGEHH